MSRIACWTCCRRVIWLFCALGVSAHGQLIYWTDWGDINSGTPAPKIQRMERDGIQIRDLLVIDQIPGAIVFDPVSSKIFWIETTPSGFRIRRANIDLSEVEDVVQFGGSMPQLRPIAIDPAGKLYWTQPGTVSGIVRSNFDGTNIELVHTAVNRSSVVAIDPVLSKIYWSFGNALYRANPDGSADEPFFVGALNVTDLAVDPVSGCIYWSTLFGSIYRVNRDGSGLITISDDPSCTNLRGISIDSGMDALFWSCDDINLELPNRMHRARLDGSEVTEVLVHPRGLPTHRFQDVAIASTVGKLFWTSYTTSPIIGKVQSTDLNLARLETVVGSYNDESRNIAFDSRNGKMYWADRWPPNSNSGGRIMRSNLDGSAVETLVTKETGGPNGIGLDLAGQKVYWSDPIDRTIQRANLDGTDAVLIHSFADESPYGLALDLAGGKMYWTSRGPRDGTSYVRRSNLDGSYNEKLVGPKEMFDGYPGNIALNLKTRTMYWALFYEPFLMNGCCVQRADLDGKNVQIIELTPANDSSFSTLGLFVDEANEKLYMTEYGGNNGVSRVRRADLDGGHVETLYSGARTPFSVALNPWPHIAVSDPVDGSIDARQPHELNDAGVMFRRNTIELTFSGEVPGVSIENFVVTEAGGDGIAPGIAAVVSKDHQHVSVQLKEGIEPGAWTCIRHVQSGTRACAGYLPGDVSGDGHTTAEDAFSLIYSMRGIVLRPVEATDIDRDGAVSALDLVREMDLLNGADAFEAWVGRACSDGER